MYLCSFPLVAKGCFRERDLFVDVPWFYERINFLPVYGQCGFKFQLKEGQRAVLLPHIHPVTICGHV